MQASAGTSEAQRFKIHRTTAATLLRRYAGLAADHQPDSLYGSGALPPDGTVCNTKPAPCRSKRPQQKATSR